MVSLIIVGILLVFLFVPFIPMSDYTVVDKYSEYITSGSTTWPEIPWVKTECVVVIKDGGVGGRYEVTFHAGYGERTSSRQIDAGATASVRVVFPNAVTDFSYDIRAPEGMKSVIQVIAGQ